MYENEKQVDHLLSVATSHKDVSQYVGPPCSQHQCRNDGVCVPVLDDYVCRCARGYQGATCDQREFCAGSFFYNLIEAAVSA